MRGRYPMADGAIPPGTKDISASLLTLEAAKALAWDYRTPGGV